MGEELEGGRRGLYPNRRILFNNPPRDNDVKRLRRLVRNEDHRGDPVKVKQRHRKKEREREAGESSTYYTSLLLVSTPQVTSRGSLQLHH